MLTLRPVHQNWLVQLLFFSWLFLAAPLVQGQSDAYYQHAVSDSLRGNWRLQTDYSSRMTQISFYTAHHELLYQEKIKDRYVKLTKRTLRRFDELLAQLVERHLVADQVKSYDLWASTREIDLSPYQPMRSEPGIKIIIDTVNQLTVNLTITEDNKLNLFYLNPTQQSLLIILKGENSTTVSNNL